MQTYNFDPVSVVQDPNVLNHEEAVVQAGSGEFGDPVDAGVKASSMDELTIGVERLIMPTLTVGLKGTYRALNSTLEDRCDFDYTSPETNYSGCALINPGSGGKFASGDAPTCNGLYDDPEWYQCYPRGPASPEVKRIYRGIELFARQSVGNSLWLQASYVYSSLRGNYDGGVNQGVYGQTNPGINHDFDYPAVWHNGYGTLALDRPNRFRFDGYWVTPWRLSVGLQAFVESGAPLNQMGYFNAGWSLDLPRPAGLGGAPADALGNEPHALLSDRDRPGDRDAPGLSLQHLQQADRRGPRQYLVHLTTGRVSRPRSTTRTRSRPTRSTARSPAARSRESSAPP